MYMACRIVIGYTLWFTVTGKAVTHILTTALSVLRIFCQLVNGDLKAAVGKTIILFVSGKKVSFSSLRHRDYKTFFMFNSAEHELCPAN